MAHDDPEEVVYAYSQQEPDDPDSVARGTRRVSHAEYAAVQTAERVLERFGEEWLDRAAVRSVSIRPLPGRGDAVDTEPEIVVLLAADQPRAPGEFPDSVDDVPVRTEVVRSEGFPLDR